MAAQKLAILESDPAFAFDPPPAAIPAPQSLAADAGQPTTAGGCWRDNRRLRLRSHEQQKRMAALKRSRDACRRSNLALIEEIATLRDQLQRRGITPVISRVDLTETELADC